MTRADRRFAPFAPVAAAALALSLAACGGDAPPTTEPSTVTVTQTPTATTDEVDKPEQQQLTAQQIKAALPSEQEAPKGFAEDPRGFDASTPSTRTTDPEACLALYMSTPEMAEFRKKHVAEGQGVRYTSKQTRGNPPSISIAVWSFDEVYPKAYFDEAGAALSDCTTFSTASSPDANAVDNSSSAIPTPTLGDQSFGVRIGDPTLDLGVDYLWVRSGHNLISVRMLTTYRMDNDQELEKYAQGVLDDLKKTP